MVYTDGMHLVAESLAELCAYADKIGLNREWLQLKGKNIHPHLDICGKVKQRVLADKNVKQISQKEIVKICQLNYREPHTENEIKELESYHNKKIAEVEKPCNSDYDRMFKNIFRRCGL